MDRLRALLWSRRLPLVVVALLGLGLAQASAQSHAYSHLGGGRDAPAVPQSHLQLCGECVAHAPLLAMAGGSAPVIAPARRSGRGPGTAALAAVLPATVPSSYRSRAPPR